MILRIWRTDFDPDRLDELQRFADETSAPRFDQLPGCLGYIHALRGATWITQTFWESERHVVEAEQSPLYRGIVDQILAAGFLGDDQETEVFEITSHAARPGEA